MEIQLLFPTAIAVEKNFLNEQDKKNIIKLCYEIKNKVGTSEVRWLSKNDSPYNTYSNYNLVKDERFNFFIKKVDQYISVFAKEHMDQTKYECENAWINIYKEGDFQEPHSHLFPVFYSAVYFPKAPKHSGKIVFQSPYFRNGNEPNYSGCNILNSSAQIYEPEDNMILIFKSDLSHYVLPGKNKDDRISIPLNYVIKKED